MTYKQILLTLVAFSISTTSFGMKKHNVPFSKQNTENPYYHNTHKLYTSIANKNSKQLGLNFLPLASNKKQLKKTLAQKDYDGGNLLHYAAYDLRCFAMIIQYTDMSTSKNISKVINKRDNMGMTPATWYVQYQSDKKPEQAAIKELQETCKDLGFKLGFARKKSKNFLGYNYYLTYICMCKRCQLNREKQAVELENSSQSKQSIIIELL